MLPDDQVCNRWGLRLWIIVWFLLAAAILFPIRFGMLRLGMAVCAVALWAGALLLFGRRTEVRIVCGALVLAVLAVGLLPGNAGDPVRLQQAYLEALPRYEGAPYVWGGETRLGIDCSGLVRKGMVDAYLREGTRTFNPQLLRQGLSLWWHDSSARALKDGYRQTARLVLTTPGINDLDPSEIRPGDFAVTSNGIHVLAYLGNRTWIEADPSVGRVVTVRVPAEENAWFDQPVHVMRWFALVPAPS